MKILTIIGNLVCIVVALNIRDDWRGDPCARAGIPWTPFSTHARLNPSTASRIMARTAHGEHLVTRERVVLKSGEEDVVVVAYHVLLSDEILQRHIHLTQSGNDVALIIDGSEIGSPQQQECVVAVTTIQVPRKVHQLVIDVEASDIEVDSLDTSFDALELLVAAGTVSIRDSALQVGHFVIDLAAGNISIDGGVHAQTQNIRTRAGTVTGTLIVGQHTKVMSLAGSVDITLMEAAGKRNAVEADDALTTPRISVSSAAGDIAIQSHLVHIAEIDAKAEAGTVVVSVEPEFEARVHLETSLGHVTYPNQMVVTSDKKSWTGRIVDGFLKRSSGRPVGVLQLSSRAGSVELTVKDRPKDGL